MSNLSTLLLKNSGEKNWLHKSYNVDFPLHINMNEGAVFETLQWNIVNMYFKNLHCLNLTMQMNKDQHLEVLWSFPVREN